MTTSKSKYYGYTPLTKSGRVIVDNKKATVRDYARGAKEAFDSDGEGMRVGYETYKRSNDPSSSEISRRIGRADEEAIDKVQRAGRERDAEYTRERNRSRARASGYAKGGMVRGDGICQRGKTKGTMR